MIIEIFRPQAEAKGISLEWKIVEDLKVAVNGTGLLDAIENESSYTKLPKINGDVRRFQQVLINLVKNALKFTLEGRITIKAWYSLQTQSIIIHVKDTGVGIAKSDFSQLF